MPATLPCSSLRGSPASRFGRSTPALAAAAIKLSVAYEGRSAGVLPSAAQIYPCAAILLSTARAKSYNHPLVSPRPRQIRLRAFTLIELMVVIGIIVVLMGLLVPAFKGMKSAGDVTSAAYTIKGILDQARTHAIANNTYTWVGFYEEDGSVPSASPTATPGTGRIVVSVVASKDGTTVYNPNRTVNPDPIDPTRLNQLGKLTKIENFHLPLFAPPSGSVTGETFDTRPVLQSDPFGVGYNASRFGELNAVAPNTAPYDTTNNGNSQFPFQYPVGSPAPAAQYTFRKTLQFNPRGESRINSTYLVRRVVEIGLLPTHGNAAPTPTPSAGNYPGNVVAIQFNGFAGDVKIYRR